MDAIPRAVAAGPLTRRTLADRIASEVGGSARKNIEHAWGGLVGVSSVRGHVCFGPHEGNEVTFVALKTWLPDVRDYPPEEAGPVLLRRYLRAFGPATPRDFQRWAEIPMPAVRAVWRALADQVAEVSVEGRRGFLLAGDLRALARTRSSPGVVRLLPSFDPFLLGHRDKAHLVDAAHYKRVYRKAGWLSPVVLVDGRIVGTWRHERRRGVLEVRVTPFRRLPRDVKGASRPRRRMSGGSSGVRIGSSTAEAGSRSRTASRRGARGGRGPAAGATGGGTARAGG